MKLPCARCPWRGGRGVVLSPERRTSSGIAALAEGPAREEVAHGRDLVGPTGREADRVLARAGIARSEIAVENAFGCWKPEKSGAAQEILAVEACRGRVEEFLEEVQPRGLFLLGGRALRSIAPGFTPSPTGDGLLRHRGSLWKRVEIEAANAAVGKPVRLPKSLEWVTATIHLAAIIGRRRIEKFPAMGYRAVPSLDLRRLRDAMRFGRGKLDLEIAEGHLPELGELKDGFVFDLETNENRKAQLIGVQKWNGGPVYSMPWEHARGWASEAMRVDAIKAGHNIHGFDMHVLADEGVSITEPLLDTMILGGSCEPDMARALYYQWAYYHGDKWPYWKELSGAHTRKNVELMAQAGLRAAWSQELIGNRVMLAEHDWEVFYNAVDVEGARLLAHALVDRAAGEGWI